MSMSLIHQVKALEYSRYDINRYHFLIAKLEASRPLATTTNNEVVENAEDANVIAADYYGVLKKMLNTHLVASKS
jgi:hypothetical protein